MAKVTSIGREVRRPRVPLGMRGHADRELPARGDELDQFERVDEVAVGELVGCISRRITGEGEDVGDACVAVLIEETLELTAGVADAREMCHRSDTDVALDIDDHVTGPFAGRATRAIGDRHERRMQRFEFGDRRHERAGRVVGLRREELERTGPARGEEIGDARHR
jgi:hypothetical protein